MRKSKIWDIDKLRLAVENNKSIAGVARDLGLKPYGGNYGTINRHIIKNNIDNSHFTGQGWNKDNPSQLTTKIDLKDILVANSTYTSSGHLRVRLVNEGILEYRCSNLTCGISSWLGKELVLHLDHINGTHNDNRIENLRLLCPNCHSQTKTYCNRKRASLPQPVEG